ncbi:MAG: metallophosphoesterase family protein [Lachnospiraceae bacterium]|nr:metallophosphoesterase family protein [Lachnospiraceae bacterium]
MRYYISDLHFFHENLIKSMDKRAFDSVEAMNSYMIEQWNSVVRKNDEIVILGDLSIERWDKTAPIVKELKGKKYLVTGNHDKFVKDKAFDSSLFKWVGPYLEMKDNNRKVVLCHYPIMCYNGQYNFSKHGNSKTYMLYGHVHNSYDYEIIKDFINDTRVRTRSIKDAEDEISIPCNMINCFCMRSDYKPLTLDQWIALEENS